MVSRDRSERDAARIVSENSIWKKKFTPPPFTAHQQVPKRQVNQAAASAKKMAMPPQQLTPTTWLLIAMTLLTKLLPYATLPPPARTQRVATPRAGAATRSTSSMVSTLLVRPAPPTVQLRTSVLCASSSQVRPLKQAAAAAAAAVWM